MIDKYITLYKTSYGLVQGFIKNEMSFEEAEKIGTKYCQEKGYEYLGTYTEETVTEAQMEYSK